MDLCSSWTKSCIHLGLSQIRLTRLLRETSNTFDPAYTTPTKLRFTGTIIMDKYETALPAGPRGEVSKREVTQDCGAS